MIGDGRKGKMVRNIRRRKRIKNVLYDEREEKMENKEEK